MTMLQIQAAIVDLDGTMVDTVGDFEAALRLALADLGQPPVGRAFIERTVGKGSEHLILCTLAEVGAPAALYEDTWARYQHHYLAINGQHSAVYAGVVDGLQALRAMGLRLACLTNKPTAFALPLLQSKGLAGFFTHSFGGDAFARKKPDPLPLLQDLRGAGHAAGAHADGRRFQQRRRRGTRGRLPGGAGGLWLQPWRAGGIGRRRRGDRQSGRPAAATAGRVRSRAGLRDPATRLSVRHRPGSGPARCAAARRKTRVP